MLQPSHIIRISDKAAYGSYNTEFRKGCSRLTLFGFHSSFQIRLRTAPIIQSSAKAARLVMYWTQLRKACGRLVR